MISKIKNKRISLIVAGIFIIICGFLARDRYIALVMCQIGFTAIAVTGLDILFGYSGQISFGHAGFYAVGAYTSAILTTRLNVDPLIAMIAAGILSIIVGIIVAFPASKLVKHFLSLMTIAFGQIAYNFVGITDELTNGFTGIGNIPPVSIFGYKLVTRQSYLVFIVVLLVLALIMKKRIIDSRTGRAFIAIKENTHAAGGIGINVRFYKIMVFAISAFYTGIAGSLYTHLALYISPDTFKPATSILFMTVLLFGGLMSLFGPLVGAVVLTLVQIWLQRFSIYQGLVYSGFIILVLFFMPNGVIGILSDIKHAINRKVYKLKKEEI